MKALIALTRTEFKLYLREPAAFFFTLVFPLMLLVLFGSIFGNDPADGFDNIGPMDASVPAYCGLIIATTAFMSLPIAISSYREKHIYRRMRATPVRPASIIVSQILVNLLLTVVGLIILFVAGKLLFDLRTPEQPGLLVISTLIGFLSMSAIGFLIGGWAPTARTAQVVGNIVFFPQLFLSGAAFPRELFPHALREWTAWLPMTIMIDTMKDAWNSTDIDIVRIVAVIAIGIVAATISIRVFSWE
ncbi:MAG TPA: ABC transporter permease [Thermomicrobiales bacterium]|nr:ABC transporter permease [Thermomicrobiales bacterium]